MIMTTAERSKWDEQLDEVYQSHEIGVERFKSVGEWGECRMLGVGYCKTKKGENEFAPMCWRLCHFHTTNCSNTSRLRSLN